MNERVEQALRRADVVAHRLDEAVRSGLAWLEPRVIVAGRWIARAAVAVWGLIVRLVSELRTWVGPVADSIKGQVNAQEVQRAVTKGVVSGTTSSLVGALKDPDFVSVVIVPILVGLGVGLLDIARRTQHGEPASSDVPASSPSPSDAPLPPS